VNVPIKVSNSNTIVPFVAIMTMLLWATCYPLISVSLTYAPVMLTAFYRAAIAGIFLIALAWILGDLSLSPLKSTSIFSALD
jgi:drug/metabolite transporter (DMT)-like permease